MGSDRSGDELWAQGTALWAELVRAAGTRGHPWRQPVLATSCPVRGAQARTVVLRDVDPAARVLIVYTDTRTPKVAQLAHDPRAQIVCWSAVLGWQSVNPGTRVLRSLARAAASRS